VWLGVSVESSAYHWRIDCLRQVHARVRFLSIEPLLAPLGRFDLRRINWVIVGGESGPGARPMNPDWVREIRDQCHARGVAFFFKQWGGLRPKSGGRELDEREWNQFPPIPTFLAMAAE
jgi:protein gp37